MTNYLASRLVAFPSGDDTPYRVNRKQETCTCPQFQSGWCKHLEAVGRFRKKSATLSSRPNFAQALSGLVKGIRLRNLDEAAHWLTYCWSFRQKLNGTQFRIVRRLLIGSAEDGHSIAVMERMADNYSALLAKDADFAMVMAELVRICKVPNWWMPETGGHDYIYHGMLGSQKPFYDLDVHPLAYCLQQLELAIDGQDKTSALDWVMRAHECGEKAGAMIARKLNDLAVRHDCLPALRLMQNIYLRHEQSLRSDTNFTCQAAWFLAGGSSPVVEQIETVTRGEVRTLIEKVNSTGPHIIPEWCCDGVHCAGNDIRYAGMWDRMYAVCNQYTHYGSVSPDDPWLEDEFYNLDGLTVEEA